MRMEAEIEGGSFLNNLKTDATQDAAADLAYAIGNEKSADRGKCVGACGIGLCGECGGRDGLCWRRYWSREQCFADTVYWAGCSWQRCGDDRPNRGYHCTGRAS
jgi:hypothetical protein